MRIMPFQMALPRWTFILILIYVFVTSSVLSQQINENVESPDRGRISGRQSTEKTAANESPRTSTASGETRSNEKDLPKSLESAREPPSAQGLASLVFVAAVISMCIVGCVAFIGGMYCWYKHTDMTSSARRVLYRSSDAKVLIHNDYQPMGDGNEVSHDAHTNKNTAKLAEKTDYPAYGVTGPNPLHCANRGPQIDHNLNRSAEVFHYQQQKERLKKLNSVSSNGSVQSRHSSPGSPPDQAARTNQNDEENSDGEYTVYECPGLAATSDGPLEIHNPLFADSEATFSSYPPTSLGGSIVTAKYNYSATVAGQ